MELLTPEAVQLFRELDPRSPDPVAVVKFSHPLSGWTWYAVGAELVTEEKVLLPFGRFRTLDLPIKKPWDVLFSCLIVGLSTGPGSVTLRELEAARTPAGLRVARDPAFTPRRLSEIEVPEVQQWVRSMGWGQASP